MSALVNTLLEIAQNPHLLHVNSGFLPFFASSSRRSPMREKISNH